jgi:hypothetical protein
MPARGSQTRRERFFARQAKYRPLRYGVGMASSSKRPPRFAFALPKGIEKAVKTVERSSPRLRGLDTKWDRLSVAFRRKNPFCRFCEQEGRDALAEVVDHMIPRDARPDLTYEWGNLQSLCKLHHDGLKQRMEMHARKIGAVDDLPDWCRYPELRPARFRCFDPSAT